jgi:hypothetical protein
MGVEGDEEFQCAQALDSLPQVTFRIRNVARDPQSFWLPTASDKFYPDFVAQLNDGRNRSLPRSSQRPRASSRTRYWLFGT